MTRRRLVWVLTLLTAAIVAAALWVPPTVTDSDNAEHARQVWEHAGIPAGITPGPTRQPTP